MIKKIHIFSLTFFFSFQLLLSQQNFTLYNMLAVPQASYTNPAFIPYSKINIGLPAISSTYFSASNSGFKYNDVVQRGEDDSLILNIENLIDKLKDRNVLSSSVQIDLLSFGYKFKKHYFTFNTSEKVNFQLLYPKDLIVFVWEGNGKSLLGKRANLDDFSFDFMHYREYAFGYAIRYNDKLTFGGKIKYLYGMENIWTKKGQLGFTTNATTYELTIDGEKEMRTSGFDDFIPSSPNLDISSFALPYLVLKPNSTSSVSDQNYLDNFDYKAYIFKKKNRGLALDLGATYQYRPDLSFSASIIDFGYIKWKTEINNYKSNKDASFSFYGKDLYELFADSNDIAWDSIFSNDIDSINSIFELTENKDSYTNMLKMQVYLGANYHINENSKAGIFLHTMFLKGMMRESLLLSYQYRLKRWLTISANYSLYNRGYSNIGVGLALNAGPVQFYIITDNILAPLYPYAFRNAQLHTGINLTFGRDKLTKKESEVQLQ